MKNFKLLFLATFLIVMVVSSCKSNRSVYWKKNKKENVLLGHASPSILNNAKLFPWYYYGKKSYQCNDSMLTLLKPLTDSISVLIVAGTWCGDTQIELPKAMKLFQKLNLNDSLISIQLVNRNKQHRFFSSKALQVKAIPCFMFYANGKEIGRIVEHPNTNFETDLYQILNKKH